MIPHAFHEINDVSAPMFAEIRNRWSEKDNQSQLDTYRIDLLEDFTSASSFRQHHRSNVHCVLPMGKFSAGSQPHPSAISA